MYQLLLVAPLLFAQDDLERVFHFNHVPAGQSMNEIATLVKVMTDLPHLQADTEGRKIVFRGSPTQGTLADWLMTAADRRVPGQASPEAFETQLDPKNGENVVKMFYLNHTNAGQQLQELATLVRSLTEVRRLITYMAEPSLTVRSTKAQVSMANWLVTQLDQPPSVGLKMREYRAPESEDDIVRVYYLPQVDTPVALQRLATKVRSASGVRQLFTYNSLHAIAVRGTATQMEQVRLTIERP